MKYTYMSSLAWAGEKWYPMTLDEYRALLAEAETVVAHGKAAQVFIEPVWFFWIDNCKHMINRLEKAN
jgi:hypothetical protein